VLKYRHILFYVKELPKFQNTIIIKRSSCTIKISKAEKGLYFYSPFLCKKVTFIYTIPVCFWLIFIAKYRLINFDLKNFYFAVYQRDTRTTIFILAVLKQNFILVIFAVRYFSDIKHKFGKKRHTILVWGFLILYFRFTFVSLSIVVRLYFKRLSIGARTCLKPA